MTLIFAIFTVTSIVLLGPSNHDSENWQNLLITKLFQSTVEKGDWTIAFAMLHEIAKQRTVLQVLVVVSCCVLLYTLWIHQTLGLLDHYGVSRFKAMFGIVFRTIGSFGVMWLNRAWQPSGEIYVMVQ